MKFKVGDKVKVKSLDWYEKNKDENGEIRLNGLLFLEQMSEDCGKEFTITSICTCDSGYFLDGTKCIWNDEMLEGKVAEEKTFGGEITDQHTPLTTKSSIDFLNESKNIQEERAIAYDSPSGERSMEKTVRAFNIITGHNIKESEGWLFQQILKDVRQWQRKDYHEDSALDCVSYASLKAEALSKGK